jgi:hypothetical protein
MPITTLDQLIAASKQRVALKKTATRTTVANGWFSLFDIAGYPGAGTLAGSSTAAGVVPDDATAGTPIINAFGGGNLGYLMNVEFANSVASRLQISDILFKAGAYGFAAGTTSLTGQPSFSGRVPGGTDFTNTEIWIEVSTAFATGTAWQVQVTYTNQSGVGTRTSIILPATAAAGLTLGRRYQLALQAGDTGVQRIDSVIVTNGGTAMTAGNFNVLVLRPLWSGRVRVTNDGDLHDYLRTGMSQLFGNSALDLMVNADGTSSGTPECLVTIANG